ncbi:uncharacterized protein LOC131624992 [Vicia villosa]|uniref:uncharacterized protein LOC131624992 n=1 Tax=Vicia villosa TaxID=3911 RepID=UPI00273AA89A|nr:uncharacterized protein LOC131624992 [Vicia villosa]
MTEYVSKFVELAKYYPHYNRVIVEFSKCIKSYISTQCQKPKKEVAAQTNDKVFALSGTEDSKKNNLIRGACFINDVDLVVIINTAYTHSFISLECASKLELELSDMDGSMIIDVPGSGFVTTTYVGRKCLLTVFDKSFVMILCVYP